MDIKQINSAIMFGIWTDTELSSMIDAIKFARAGLVKQQKRALSLGTAVSFTSSKTGMTYKGTVEKIAQKFVTVNTGSGRWKVPANMLVIG
jgi:translation initiation factor 2B subunit (eIF-2B alpha/beta/delta family)